jgi:hypothetical protein
MGGDYVSFLLPIMTIRRPRRNGRFLLSLRLYYFYVELFYLMEFRGLDGNRDVVCMHGTDYT